MKNNWEEAAFSFINSLSSSSPTPGGGAAGAVSAAMGCALGEMMCGISSESPHVNENSRKKLKEALPLIKNIKQQLMKSISEDAAAFDNYMKASKDIGMSAEQRKKAVQDALKHAAEVPLNTAKLSCTGLQFLQSLKGDLSPLIMSDYFAAETLLKASIKCSAEIVRINLKYIKDRAFADETAKKLKVYEYY